MDESNEEISLAQELDASPDSKGEVEPTPAVEGDEGAIDRREAMRALAKYSVGAGSAAVVVLSSKDALSMGVISVCRGSNPPPWCP